MYVLQKQTTVSIDGTPTRQDNLVGMQSIHHQDMDMEYKVFLNNSKMWKGWVYSVGSHFHIAGDIFSLILW